MRISNECFSVLQNFAQINEGLVVDEPTCLKTMSVTGSVISVYDTDEEFPFFAIWDLQKFNSLISVPGIENCEFDFKDDHILISYGSRKIKYEYADASSMPVFEEMKESNKYKAFNDFDFKFSITAEDIKEIKRISSIFGTNDTLKIEMKDDIGVLTVFSEKNDTNSDYTIEIDGEGSGIAYLKISDLIMLNGDYKANVTEQMIKFQNTEKPLIYFIRVYLIDR